MGTGASINAVTDITVDVLNNRGATVSVSRAVKNFGDGIEVFASLPVDLPEMVPGEELSAWEAARADALRSSINFLKVQVFDALGLEYTDEKGIITEKVAKAFAVKEQTSAPKAPARTTTPASAAPSGDSPAPVTDNARSGVSCPQCNGEMWDNRESKKNPRQPDFKCKDKGCEGVIWPPRKGN